MNYYWFSSLLNNYWLGLFFFDSLVLALWKVSLWILNCASTSSVRMSSARNGCQLKQNELTHAHTRRYRRFLFGFLHCVWFLTLSSSSFLFKDPQEEFLEISWVFRYLIFDTWNWKWTHHRHLALILDLGAVLWIMAIVLYLWWFFSRVHGGFISHLFF